MDTPRNASPIPLDGGATRLGAASLGLVCGVIYLHYAWYRRDDVGADLRKALKIRVLLALAGQNGVLLLISRLQPDTGIFCLYAGAALTMSIAAMIVGLVLVGFWYGYLHAMPGSRMAVALDASFLAIFEGWTALKDMVHDGERGHQLQAKIALSRIVSDAQELLHHAARRGRDEEEFRRVFRSIVAAVLQGFFQQSDECHPNYCACYFRPQGETRRLRVAASVSGSESYAVDATEEWRPGSLVHACFVQGRIQRYPPALAGLIAPIRPGLKRWVALPAVPYENAPPECRHGVLTVDSSVGGNNFTDPFNVNILYWLATIVGQLDEALLQENQRRP